LAVTAQEREYVAQTHADEFYFVLEGTGRMRVGDETLTVPKYGGVLVGPDRSAKRLQPNPWSLLAPYSWGEALSYNAE
jgi:hypothetical protein